MTTTLSRQKRIFTIAGKQGLAIITDSKIPEGRNAGTFKKFEEDNTLLACLKALNYELDRMPKGVRFDYKIAFLLPKTIAFLGYEDTRKFWLTYRYRKHEFNPDTGEVLARLENGVLVAPEQIDEEILKEVNTLDKLLEVQKENVQLFRQENLTSSLYNAYKRETWNILSRCVPGEEVVSCNY